MKLKPMKPRLPLLLGLLAAASWSAAQVPTSVVVEQGPHHRTWGRVQEVHTPRGPRYRDRTDTTAFFNVMGDGTFHGERYDIWQSAPRRVRNSSFVGSVSTNLVLGLSASMISDHGWTNEDGVAVYKYGMMDYDRFGHPKAIGEFLAAALEKSLAPNKASR